MKDQFSQVAHRTRRYKFADGTTELMLGGITFWGGISFNAPSPLLTGILAILGAIIVTVAVESLQRKYVYPRAGYVEYRETTRRGIWKPILAGLTAMLVFVAIFWWLMVHDPDHALAWIAPLLGLYLGLTFLYCAIAFKFWRLAVVGLVSLGAGLLLSPLVIPLEALAGYGGIGTMAFYFLVISLALLVSGGLAFRAFLRRNPVEKEEQP
ncbi:MAG: hypothetical protein JXB85_07780 [Anaerolineales bacterium]|nr:hypothetical protein [Anaerolineales bacterium]